MKEEGKSTCLKENAGDPEDVSMVATPLTWHRHFSAPHQVTFVANQNDRNVLCLPGPAELDSQLRRLLEAGPVCDGVYNEVGIPNLHAVVLEPFILPLMRQELPWAQVSLINEAAVGKETICTSWNTLAHLRKEGNLFQLFRIHWSPMRMSGGCEDCQPREHLCQKDFYCPILLQLELITYMTTLPNNISNSYRNYQKWVFSNFQKSLPFPSDEIKDPFVRIGRFSENRRSSVDTQKPKIFKKQVLRMSTENVNFI